MASFNAEMAPSHSLGRRELAFIVEPRGSCERRVWCFVITSGRDETAIRGASGSSGVSSTYVTRNEKTVESVRDVRHGRDNRGEEICPVDCVVLALIHMIEV